MGKKEKWTEDKARIIENMCRHGVPVRQVAAYVGLSWETLRQHYRKEMDKGMAEANNKIGELLYTKALKGDTTAQIFWAKCRMGWNERQQVDHISSDGSMSNSLTKEQRDAIFRAAQLMKTDDGPELGKHDPGCDATDLPTEPRTDSGDTNCKIVTLKDDGNTNK